MNKTYLITGGLGFIGRAIAKSLSSNNLVIIVDNNFRKKKIDRLKNKNIKIIKIDITEKNNFKKINYKIDSVIHLAFINGTNFFYEKPDLVLDVALKGIINVIDYCKKKSIEEFYLASSSEVYQDAKKIPTDEKVQMIIPDPHNPRYSYAAGKIISELIVLNNTFLKRSIIFRPHNIYGPNMGYNHVIPEITQKALKLKRELPIQGDGLNTRSFCYIDDFVEAFNLLVKKGKHKNIYNIGTDEEISIKKLVKKIITLTNKKLLIKKNIQKKGNAKRRCPDLSKIKKIGYKQKVSLDKGLKKTFDWYKKDLKL